MTPRNISQNPVSVFADAGFKKAIAALMEEVADLYMSDDMPWVIGYSGGKDKRLDGDRKSVV